MLSSPDGREGAAAATLVPFAPATDVRGRLLDVIAREGPRHRAELARRLEVSRTTISKIVTDLLEDRALVVLDGEPDGGSARLKERLGLNPDQLLLATVIFQITSTEVTLGAGDGRVLAYSRLPVNLSASGTERLEQARGQFKQLLADGGLSPDAVRAFYVAVNTQLDHRTGEVLSESASEAWFGTNPMRTIASWAPGAIVQLENTARLVALAEYLAQPLPRPRCMAFIEVSWGIGMGLVQNGRTFTGGYGGAGEIGHMSLDHRGEPCDCGNRGCLQNIIGNRAVLARASERLGREVDELDDLIGLAEADDPEARALIREIGDDLGAGLVTVCNLLEPELILVGGDVAALGPELLDAAEVVVRQRALALSTRSLRILPASTSPLSDAASRAALWVLRQSCGAGLLPRVPAGSLVHNV